MKSIFSIDNPVFRAISRVGDMALLSLLWFAVSLPVFTIGASTTALYDCTIKIIRGRDSGIFKDYFRSFKNNFKQATGMFLIMAAIGALLVADMYYWAHTEGTFAFVMNALSLGAALIFCAALLFLFPVQAVFENKVKDTMRTAFLMSVKHWYVSLMLLAVIFGISYVCSRIPVVAYVFLVIGTGTFAMIFSVQFITIFRKYNPELNPDELEEGAGEPVLQKLPERGGKKDGKKAKPVKIRGSKIIR